MWDGLGSGDEIRGVGNPLGISGRFNVSSIVLEVSDPMCGSASEPMRYGLKIWICEGTNVVAVCRKSRVYE